VATRRCWAELVAVHHGNRLGWAERAYEEFRAGLLPEIQASLSPRRRDTNVVLYGKSQAGKSTLALALLGVPPERFAEVESVLRGDRDPGTSVTVAPTRYAVADDDRWTWQYGDGDPEHVTADALVEHLSAVRAAMERGVDRSADILHVGLPRRLVADRHGVRLRILDLPGVGAVNAAERRYVDHLLPGWIEVADAVVLVGQAHQMKFLAPAEIGIDSLRNWHLLPHRFRVVLTHAYTNVNYLGKVAKDHRVIAPDALRRHLLPQLAKDAEIPRPTAEPEQWLYPLDFGNSWINGLALEGVTDAMRAAITASRDEILAQLRLDLQAASRQENRIRGAFQVGEIARELRRTREQRLDAHIAHAASALADAEKLDRWRRETVVQYEKLQADNAWRRALTAQVRADLSNALTLRLQAPTLVDQADYLQARRDLVDECGRLWNKWVRAVPDDLHPYPHRPPTDRYGDRTIRTRIKALAEDLLRRRRVRLRKARRDLRATQVLADHRAAVEALTAVLRDRAEADLDEIDARLTAEAANIAARLDAVRHRTNASTDDIAAASDRVTRTQAARSEESASLARAVIAAEAFPALLRNRYEDNRERQHEAIAATIDPMECLAAAVALLDAARVYDTLRGRTLMPGHSMSPDEPDSGQSAFDEILTTVLAKPLGETLAEVRAVTHGVESRLDKLTGQVEDALRTTERTETRVAAIVTHYEGHATHLQQLSDSHDRLRRSLDQLAHGHDRIATSTRRLSVLVALALAVDIVVALCLITLVF